MRQDEFGVAGTPFAASVVAVVVAVIGIFMGVLRSDLVPWRKIQSRYDILLTNAILGLSPKGAGKLANWLASDCRASGHNMARCFWWGAGGS